MVVLAVSGPDNVGKSTQLRLLGRRAGMATLGALDAHDPRWASAHFAGLSDWWFGAASIGEVVDVLACSYLGRAGSVSGEAGVRLADRGLPMLEATVVATAAVREHLGHQAAADRAIRRVRPGEAPYWVLPGGGVEAGEDLETALGRELREEIAATADVHSLLHILERGDERQYFYLARVGNWSAEASARSGPEFADPARGEYHLQAVPLTADAVAAIDLKPDELAEVILHHLRGGTDLFTLPDLRTTSVSQAC